MKELQCLVGEQLSAVCFVQDYLQLEFDGYKLTTYTTPLVETLPNEWMAYEHEQYKNGLCRFIARLVEQVVSEPGRILLAFRDCSERISLPIHEGKDNVYYTDLEGGWFVV
ncbi:hypothetical protein [Hymenobacter segetis]|uniref:Uncharacterized protein n=1 Tax=Hymenobacter segetis TaxID=2025509 RepID=A0ABU9M370_9BACT